MIDLQSVSSLPIQYDAHTSTFTYFSPVNCLNRKKVELSKLIPGLLNKSLRYPEEVYEEHSDLFMEEDEEIFNGKNLHYEMIILPPGLLGIEFIKSHIYFTPKEEGKFSSVVECLHGILTVIIQKNEPKDELDFETSINEGIMVNLRKGNKIAIPAGYYYTFVNTKDKPAIFSRLYKNKGILNYNEINREQGLGYFAIRKNARTEIVFNPRYKNIPTIKKFTPSNEKFCMGCGNYPLYEAVRKNPSLFIQFISDL